MTRCDRTRNQEALNLALHEAVRRGSEQCFRILLKGGADVHATNVYGESLLVTALNAGRRPMVEALFEEGYEVDRAVGNSLDTGQVVPLHLAIMRNQPEMVELLLKHGANSEFTDVDRDTPMISAANAESMDIVKLLIKYGGSVNAVGFEGNTSLHRAVEMNNTELLVCLLGAKPRVDVQNEHGNTALLLACEFGYLECAELLMEAGAKPGVVNNGHQNALHLSVMDGNMDIIRLLLASDLNPDAVDLSGNTALILAAFLKHESVCLHLIDRGADISLQGESGHTVAHWAAAHGLIELLKALIAHPKVVIDIEDANGDTPILLAAQNTHYDCVRLLIQAGADPSRQGTKGYNCLHWAAIKGSPDEPFQAILQKIADVNAKDEKENTPLVLAALNSRYSLMQALLDRKECNVNAQGEEGRNALHWVSDKGHHDMVWQLLKKEASEDIADDNIDTPLILATKGKHADVVEELLNYGANPNIVDSKGRTPLHWACIENHIDIVNILLCAAIVIDTADNAGDTSIHLASRAHHDKVVEALLKVGADCNVMDSKNMTPLCYMAETSSIRTVACLLEMGALVDSDKFKASPLIQACKKGHFHVVNILLDNMAVTTHQDGLGRTAFLWAAATGREAICRLLVEQDADTRHCDKSGDNALTLASWHGHPNLLEYLLPLSCIEHEESEEGMTALLLAVCRDNRDCVRVLLEAGANVNATSRAGNNALVLAATHTAGPDIMAMVLDSGQEMDYNYRGEKGRAAIHWSVGDPDAVAILLGKTPPKVLDLDTEDDNGASPLLLAIAHGQPESARLIIEAGCNKNKVHKDGRQPLHHCALYGDATTLQSLLQSGIDPNVLTKEGRTALLLASIEGHVNIAKVLIEHHCSVDCVFLDAITPLSVAADRKFYEIMEMLLLAGAEPDSVGVDRHTPLMTCTFNEDLQGMCLLLKANADVNQTIDSGGNRLMDVAIMKYNMPALHLLLAAGMDSNHIKKILTNGVIHYFVRCPAGAEALRTVAAAPRPLQQLCRFCIRQCIGYPITAKLPLLDLPPMMRDYLAMTELERFYQTGT